ncbi:MULTISPECIES: RFX family transcription factor [unclassified Streptomyces]
MYLAPAEASGITPGGPPMTEADWGKLIKEWFPGLADRRLRQVTWPEIDKHRDYIKNLRWPWVARRPGLIGLVIRCRTSITT